MANPINNAIKAITKRDLVTCKRCGCHDLAWVQFKSGKWGLVETASRRPFWRGDGPCPEGLYALKFNYHRCDDYRKGQAAIELRKQSTVEGESVSEYLTHAVVHLYRPYLSTPPCEIPQYVMDALVILSNAATRI